MEYIYIEIDKIETNLYNMIFSKKINIVIEIIYYNNCENKLYIGSIDNLNIKIYAHNFEDMMENIIAEIFKKYMKSELPGYIKKYEMKNI